MHANPDAARCRFRAPVSVCAYAHGYVSCTVRTSARAHTHSLYGDEHGARACLSLGGKGSTIPVCVRMYICGGAQAHHGACTVYACRTNSEQRKGMSSMCDLHRCRNASRSARHESGGMPSLTTCLHFPRTPHTSLCLPCNKAHLPDATHFEAIFWQSALQNLATRQPPHVSICASSLRTWWHPAHRLRFHFTHQERYSCR